MKKFLGVIVLLFCLCPILAQASNDGIEQFKVLVTVLENGDLYVQEAFSLNGTYNGMDRELYYKNSYAPAFTKTVESLKGSDIYNGSDIELIQIRAIPYTDRISWEEMMQSGTQFQKTYSAQNGAFGVYQESKLYNGVTYRIYNPSIKRNFFYLEYIIKNLAITHNDIAEIGWNIFGANFKEDIHSFDMDIIIPNNQKELRAWAHGPLHGEIELKGKNQIHLSIENLKAYTAVDTRFVFDKEVLTEQNKKSDMTALQSIIEIETEQADAANRERMKYRILLGTLFGFNIVWIIGLIILVRKVYKKHDKEYESTFKTKYYRDFPAEYSPSTVGYLFHKTVGTNDLSACLLNLIQKKVITVQKIDKKDYQLDQQVSDGLTEAEEKLIRLIFREPSIKLSTLKKKAKSGYNSFINDFNAWKNSAMKEAEQEDFFENKSSIKLKASLYCLIGIGIGIFSVSRLIFIGVISIILAIIALLYFLMFTKRTQKGNEQYLKWKALKNFMEDFGTMDKKDLPELVLWEKYLVYAVSLGCADKLAKTMELRIAEFNDMDMIDIGYNMHMMRDMVVFNRVISNSLNTTVNNAYSARSAATSSNSSGSGFGGGFSGGGGSFGGGSGGGRF